MTILSFAQNFEDVILHRALSHVTDGFYVDVGAYDPNIHSVTKSFYLQGWTGINIEPLELKQELFKLQRPNDINLEVLISDRDEILVFHEDTNGGLSTADQSFFENAVARGFEFKLNTKPATTLNTIFQKYLRETQEIHFLKIDVEGFESRVLAGLDLSAFRPWVVVVEANEPMTQVRNEQLWEKRLLDSNYIYVYKDGLNRFYLAKEHSDLAIHFEYPPNVFDDFIVESGLVSRNSAFNVETILDLKMRLEYAQTELSTLKKSKSWHLAQSIRKIYIILRLLRQPVYFIKERILSRLLFRSVARFEKLKLEDLVPVEKFSIKFENGLKSRGDWRSEVISEARFKEDNFFAWMNLLKEKPTLHNKQFQQYAIMEAANSVPIYDGTRRYAIGFGVGREPIPAALIQLGFDVIATDYLDGEIASQWKNTGELADNYEELNLRGIASAKEFAEHLRFRNLDMNILPAEYSNQFDFVWSSCSLGHIGGYQAGLDFIENSLKLLKPGGIALHTTELDASSFKDKYESSTLNFYKLKDLNEVIGRARAKGFSVSNIELPTKYRGVSEKYVVREPWAEKPHIRIEIYGREILSTALIFHRPKS